MPTSVCTNTKKGVVPCLEKDMSDSNGTKEPNNHLDSPLAVSPSHADTALEFAWVETLAVPVVVLDPSQYVVAYNSKMADVVGTCDQEILRRTMRSILNEGSRERLDAAVNDIVEKTASSSTCDVVLSTSGKRVRMKLSAHQGCNGQTPNIVCFAEEQEVVEIQAPFEGTQKSLRFPTMFIDSGGIVTLWNSHLKDLLGYDESSVVGRLFLEFVPDQAQQRRLQRVFTEVEKKGSHAIKTCFVDVLLPSLETKSVAVSITTRCSASAQIIGYCAILSDASDLGEPDESVIDGSSQSALHDDQSSATVAHELRQLVDSANTAIFGVDCGGLINEWNNKTVEITGFSKEESLNQPLVEAFIYLDLQKDVEEVLRLALTGQATSNFELEMETKSGEVRYLLVNATPRRDLDNNISGVVAMAQDITEAWKHDRAVAAMANELRKLIDTANAPIFGIDIYGDVNEWNDKTAEITGYTREEAFDYSLVDTFIVPAMRDSVQDVFDNALEGRGTSNYELEFRTKSNEIRHLLVNATTRRDAENNVVGVVGVAQDVTEAVQRDRAVAGMALELRQLIDTANAPIFGIDIDGNVNEWNRRTSEITGYLKEEAFDEPLVETFIAESMQDKVQEILDSALAGNETSNYELEFVSKSGEPIFLLVNATTRRDPENVVVGVVGVAQDVTEDRKHSQSLREMQYLRASQEAKVTVERNMTAYFAHELRNPLGAIDSALNAMPDDLPEAARSLISGMQLCSGFMSSIMNNLLDVRKMEEGKMRLSKSPISLKKLLNNVHKMLLPSIRPGVDFLKVANTKGTDWVLGDAHRIQQVMTNVVTNAIKYTVMGSVTLQIGWEGDQVKFECIDTGPGIPKNEQEKLFQRFVQRGGAPGTGLGLAIAKHLVDLTGGLIRFDSDPTVKAGTTCVVLMSLPLCDTPESVVEESTALIQEPISFLIIDDIKMNRMMLKRRIGKGIAPNAAITEAATGEVALEICGKEKFDIIVVDQYMEEAGGIMVGTDVVFAMRRMRIDSVVIGCSGNDMGTQFFDAGADWVWQKPMPSNTKVIQDLRASLNKRAIARRLAS